MSDITLNPVRLDTEHDLPLSDKTAPDQGFTQGAAGSVARTFQSRFADSVSVKDFGATGDGTTDDSAAVQAAINYLETASGRDSYGIGGNLFFPAGAYVITNISITRSGIRLVGDGKDATFLVNNSTTNQMLSIVTETDFVDLQFRNTVHRQWGASFLISGAGSPVRLKFQNVDFVSSAFNTGGVRNALICNFVSLSTFETKFEHCIFWGCLGCAIEIPDGPQSDTLFFDHCIWMYCSLAGALGIGSASGINNATFISCKVVANQGGTYTSTSSDNFSASTIAAASTGTIIQVANATNYTVRKCVVIGTNTPALQYAFITAISGTSITLDRSVTVNNGDTIVHGSIGFILAHTHTTNYIGTQLEGCDIGLYSTTGRQTTFENGSIGSCARPFLLNGSFQYFKASGVFAGTIGTMKNSVAWQFVTVLSTPDVSNLIDLSDTYCEASGYYNGFLSSLVVVTGNTVRTIFRSRSYGTEYQGAALPGVTFQDNSGLLFNRSDAAHFTQQLWATNNTNQWALNYANTAGDLVYQRVGSSAASLTLSGANGVPQLGDGKWNGVPIRLGSYYLWIDSLGTLRIKNSAPTSDTDGTVVGVQS